MRIHVVTAETESNQILARLARLLTGQPGYTIGTEPDKRADVNYFFPYLLYNGFKGTKTAAWFTHIDEGMPEKVDIWNMAAQSVDLRLTSAQLYLNKLSRFGKSQLVTPPLDREMFKPAERQVNAQPIIGTSGYVYGSGRKGERMIAQLAEDLRGRAKFKAIGAGWPIPTQEIDWREVPCWYRSLDLYVCTSMIEGVGYGPLEALACGVPVVIPQNVGVFDEIPDTPSIYRYTAGDYKSFRQAIYMAFPLLGNPIHIGGTLDRFTLANWLGDHAAAFDNLLWGNRATAQLSEWKGRAGAYCVAYRPPARECARRLIDSWHKFMPDVPIALVSDEPVDGADVFIQNADEDIGGRSVKTKIYDLAPKEWDYVLYLDSDTELVQPVNFLFDLLQDGWEAAFCTNPSHYVVGKEMIRPDNEEECLHTFKIVGTTYFLQFNGGVFCFRRNENTARFFRDWHTEWNKYGKRDQAALDRVLYRNPIRVYVLTGIWNCVVRYHDVDPKDACILHYPTEARSWKGVINGRLDSSEAWAATHPGGKK